MSGLKTVNGKAALRGGLVVFSKKGNRVTPYVTRNHALSSFSRL